MIEWVGEWEKVSMVTELLDMRDTVHFVPNQAFVEETLLDSHRPFFRSGKKTHQRPTKTPWLGQCHSTVYWLKVP